MRAKSLSRAAFFFSVVTVLMLWTNWAKIANGAELAPSGSASVILSEQSAGAETRSPSEANTGDPCAPACIVPDNSAGTADLPAPCAFVALQGGMAIINGLPPGTTIDVDPVLYNFVGIVRTPGGSLGGEILQFNATLQVQSQGTGSLPSFSRVINIPTLLEIHTAPRTPFTSPQSFDADLFRLQGQVTGDPDFDLLRITAGTNFGMPSPGHTTLTLLPDGSWSVDSYFDITYRIDFVGAPSGAVAGMSGSTTGTVRMNQGHHFWVPADGHKMHFPQLPDAAGWDVRAVSPMTLGDDWLCSGSGPVQDIHFWGSWLNGTVGVINSFDISIYSDVPAGVDLPYSHPGSVLWQRNVTDFCQIPLNPTSLEGWYSPAQGIVLPNNHVQYFQYDVTLGPADYFTQSMGTIYWLCIKAHVADSALTSWGWKSSLNHYHDDAVWLANTPSTCVASDNGSGSVDLPAPCIYSNTSGTFDIINGLPPLTQINSQGKLHSFVGVTHSPGGSLGGGIDNAQATLDLTMLGTGTLASFVRNKTLLINTFEVHNAPRLPFDAVQSFDQMTTKLFGQITGDPDFDLLRITGGADFGMPSPGHTTLSLLPSGQWNVDSFFDLMYRLDFIGAPGGPLAGMSGSTTGTVRIHQGGPAGTQWVDLRVPPTFATSMDLAFVITNGTSICDCRPGDANGSGTLSISDAVKLLNYIFAGGSSPIPYPACSGDANCNCIVSISDVVYLINYIFAGGPAPCDCATWRSSCGALHK